MKNKRLFMGIMAMFLVFCALLIGCSAKNPLVGTWIGSDFGIESELIFKKDGTFTEKALGLTVDGTYSVNGKTLTINNEMIGTISYDFEINGNILSYSYMGMDFTYTKK